MLETTTSFCYLKGSKMKFLDTMSMHIAICGFTSFQRVLFNAKNSGKSLKDLKKQHPSKPSYKADADEVMTENL